MKGQDIFEALGEIDEKTLEKCEPNTKPKIRTLSKWAAAVACVCVVVAGYYVFNLNSANTVKGGNTENKSSAEFVSNDNDKSSENIIAEDNSSTVAVYDDNDISEDNTAEDSSSTATVNTSENDEEYETDTETALIPKWDDMTIAQQYSSFEYDSGEYLANGTEISDIDRIGEKLGDIEISGYDVYTEAEHQISAEIYGITGFSSSFAMAIKYEGQETYYSCTNINYRPDNLQQLLDDTNLAQDGVFDTICRSYFDDNMDYHDIEYTVNDSDYLYNLLFGNIDNLSNETDEYGMWDDYEVGISEYSIGIKIPLLGIGKSINLTENGYLWTNLVETGAVFFYGNEKIETIVSGINDSFPQKEEITPAQDEIYREETENESYDTSEEKTVVLACG